MRTRLLSLPLALGLVLTGCSDDAEPLASGTIEITATDYSFGSLPDRIEAGSTLTLSNASEAEVHELVAVRLPDDEQRPASELVQLPMPELAAFFPLVTTVVIAPPSAPEGMVVEGSATLTDPGRYLFLCAIPTGADPDEYLAAAAAAQGGPPEVDGGPPHFVNGMFAEVEVVAG